ncbi:hypothetical protein K0M31_017767 [Melipona bicolor]|uniref:Uncharacterized protein n=1 Tax=Melipona bicolor TaxID=60889 RepID=A0AA40G5Y8_9HYME|nr:hypothetical protein K0M31_017767 [Melipona bicolor]
MYPPNPPRNPNYENDFIYVTKYLKWILNSIGIWPAMLKGIGRFLPKIAIVLSNLVFIFFEVQCMLHITLEEKDPSKLRILGLASYTLVGLLKYWALIIRKSRIRYCIEEMNTDWKQVSCGKCFRDTKWKNDAYYCIKTHLLKKRRRNLKILQ